MKHLLFIIVTLWCSNMFAQTTILQEDFEGKALPLGWQQEFSNTPSVSWLFGAGGFPFHSGAIDYSQTPPLAHGGLYNAVFHNPSGDPAQTKLIMPAIDMSDKRVYKLNFWFMQGCFYNQSLTIYYKEGASGSWKRLKTLTDILYSWQNETINIPSSSAQVFIAFEGLWDGGCGICLDDIAVQAYNSYDITFQATDMSGTAISGATIIFSDTIKLSNPTGNALFQRVPQSSGVPVVIRKLGFRPLHATINVTKNETFTYKLPYSRILYVKKSATGANNGKNWTDAYTNLQQAIDSAYEGDQIWIAKGIYKPSKERTTGVLRTASFNLKNEVSMFGGFSGVAGTEGSIATRNATTYPCVLSGDVDNNDILDATGLSSTIIGNNAYFIMYNNDTHIDNSSILDGVYISGGKSNNSGVAIYNYKVSPTYNNCVIANNESTLEGVVYNKQSSAQFLRCTFANNKKGAMLNSNSNMQLQNCTFTGNTLYGVMNTQTTAAISNCVFDSNTGVGMINNDASPSVFYSSFNKNTIGMQNMALANPQLYKLSFTNNDSLGISINNAGSKIDSCTFSYNKKGAMNNVDQNISNILRLNTSSFSHNGDGSQDGGAIYNEGFVDISINNCTFTNDTAQNGGAIFCRDNQNLVLTNCLFRRNGAANNGGALATENSSPQLRHCTFATNFAQTAGGAIQSSNGTVTIKNSILWNDSTAASGLNETVGNVSITYSAVQGIAAGNNNISQDPRFIDITAGVLRLKGNSPAINAANAAVGVLTDLRGNPRPQGSSPDMGCYERDYGIEIIWASPSDNQAIVGPIGNIAMKFDDLLFKKAAGTIAIYDYKTDALVHTINIADVTIANDTLKYTTPTPLPYGLYYFVITPNALAGINSGYTYIGTEPRDDYNFSLHRPVLYVKHDATGTKTGFSWTDAYTNLQAALDTAVSGQKIWVARGSYTPSLQWDKTNARARSFIPKRGVSILGGFPGAAGQENNLTLRNPSQQRTILSGDLDANDPTATSSYTTAPSGQNALHIIYCTTKRCDTSTVIDGFTITSGLANATGNTTGAAIYANKAGLSVLNCTIAGNTATTSGGALFAQNSTLLVAQCLLAFNSAATASVADLPNSTARFLNTSIVKNTITSGSAFENNAGLISTNNIIWGNTPSTTIFAQAATVNYSLVQDAAQGDGTVISGTANLDSLPRFIDFANNDFRLRSCSPAVDAGNNAAITYLFTTDIAKLPRFYDGDNNGSLIVDLGAWEFDGNCATYQCATKYDNCWIGCYDKNWHNPLNWTAGIPSSTQAVYVAGIDKTCYQPSVLANQTANANTLDIDTDNQATITIDATNNAILKVNQ